MNQVLAFAVGAFFVIPASDSAGHQGPTTYAADSSLLSAIVKAAIIDTGPGEELRVDPLPLVARDEMEEVLSKDMVPVSPEVLRRRTEIIRAAGLRTVDAVRVKQSKDCPGIFYVGKRDSLRRPLIHPGCPKQFFYVLAIALPRPGTRVFPGQVYDRDTQQPARGHWAARVIRTAIGPGGTSLYAADYVLARRGGKWSVIKIVGILYSE